jgi:hypothetical protein
MIVGIFHKGSGLGNQLHRYVATRCLALEKGEEFGMAAPDLFKGASFLNLDMGISVTDYEIEYPAGKVIPKTDATVIDGEFQGEEVWENHIDVVREWLKVEPLEMPDDLCVINFRGGEYKVFPNLYLTKEYWESAIALMQEKNPNMRFEIHTDDPDEAKKFFPDYPIIRDIGFNWRSVRYAKHLVLSNSSFAILPAHLNEEVREIIAPLGWAAHNLHDGTWSMPENRYKRFQYI